MKDRPRVQPWCLVRLDPVPGWPKPRYPWSPNLNSDATQCSDNLAQFKVLPNFRRQDGHRMNMLHESLNPEITIWLKHGGTSEVNATLVYFHVRAFHLFCGTLLRKPFASTALYSLWRLWDWNWWIGASLFTPTLLLIKTMHNVKNVQPPAQPKGQHTKPVHRTV